MATARAAAHPNRIFRMPNSLHHNRRARQGGPSSTEERAFLRYVVRTNPANRPGNAPLPSAVPEQGANAVVEDVVAVGDDIGSGGECGGGERFVGSGSDVGRGPESVQL